MDGPAREAISDTILDALQALVQSETAYWQANGPRPSYSLDGQSFDWPSWLAEMEKRIDFRVGLGQKLGGPAPWANLRMIGRT